jgi:hypothetical protein
VPDPKRLKRVIAWISEDQHRLLRSKLALRGETVADWIRKKIKELLDEDID